MTDRRTDILDRIDDTLTYYSAGLGGEVTVPVEKPDMDPLTWTADEGAVRDMERELRRAMAEACDRHWREYWSRRARLRRMRHLYQRRRR